MFEIKRKLNQAAIPRESTAVRLGYPQPKPQVQPDTVRASVLQDANATPPLGSDRNYQTRTPVITGEINYKGMLPVDGVVTGNLGATGGTLVLRQKTASCLVSGPELSGEISFRDLLRVNGHIAGTVYSKIGTLIVDNSATVEANIEVGVAIVSGTVHGDIVARDRVEIGPTAKIYGNIWTRSISIKDGAVFDGVCTMLEVKLA